MRFLVPSNKPFENRTRFISCLLTMTFFVSLIMFAFPQITPKAEAATSFLTSGTTWTVPSDWNNSSNTIEVIGGGGGGSSSTVSGTTSLSGYGGGGGGYSKATNVSLTPGATVAVAIGTGGAAGVNGGDSYVCNSTSNCASITGTAVVVGAKGGANGTNAFGGSSSGGVGSVKYSGGNGNGGNTGAGLGGGGGGGAGGPNGNGASTTASGTSTGGSGGQGDSTFGGAGGTGGSGVGPAGSNGTEWDSAHGSGGGGAGGAGSTTKNTPPSAGGNGGTYGAGGGGAGGNSRNTTTASGGAGAAGLIVITYTPIISYTQTSYGFFTNADSTTPGSALAVSNTAVTLSSPGQVFRLRQLIKASSSVVAGGQAFNEQYAPLGTYGSCSAIPGANWQALTTNSPIAYYNNPTPASGAAITYQSGTDPTDTGQTVAAQTYTEADGFNSTSTYGGTVDGEWDLSLYDNGSSPGITYCLRTVLSNGTALNTYSSYPMITTDSPSVNQVMRDGAWFYNGVKQPLYL